MDKIICKVSQFDEFGVKYLAYLINLAKENKQDTLPVFIDSYGGEVYSALAMVDMLKASGLEIITVCIGKAMSAGAVLFSIGKERYITENSTIMIHKVQGRNAGNSDEMGANAEEAKRLTDKLLSLIDENTGNKEGFFANLLKESNNTDFFIDAKKAIELGLATKIGFPEMSIFSEKQNDIFLKDFENGSNEEKTAYLMQYMNNQEKVFSGGEKENKKTDDKIGNMGNNNFNDKIGENMPELNQFEKRVTELEGTVEKLTNALKEKENQFKEMNSQYSKIVSGIAQEIKRKDNETLINRYQMVEGKITQAQREKALAILNNSTEEIKKDFIEFIDNLPANKIFTEIKNQGDNDYEFISESDPDRDEKIFLAEAEKLGYKNKILTPEQMREVFNSLTKSSL